MGRTDLLNLLGIWNIDLDRVGRKFRVEQECGIQMNTDKVRVDIPFGEDLVCEV